MLHLHAMEERGRKGEGAGEAEAGVERVTGIGQDIYLHSNNDNEILSKRLLRLYSSTNLFWDPQAQAFA